MRRIFILFLLIYSACSWSQDAVKLQQIDSLVKVINQSTQGISYDSIFQEHKDLGLSFRTYLTTIMNGKELKKFSNKVFAKTDNKGVVEETITENAFYFDQKKLIKVEEYGMKDGKRMDMYWYFENSKPLYYTLQSDKAESRANLLLEMAKAFLEKIQP